MNLNLTLHKRLILISGLILPLNSVSQHSLIKSLKSDEKALSFDAGTLGLGFSYVHQLKPDLNLRAGAGFFQLSPNKDVTMGKMSFNKDQLIRLGGAWLTADWQCFEKLDYLHLSGGLVFNYNYLRETRSYSIQEDGSSEDLGSLTLDFNTFPLNPYLGVLLGRPISDKKFSFTGEIGTFYHGAPQVNFTGEGRIAPTAEQDEIVRDNVKNYRFYPLISLHLNYHL